MSLTIFHNVCHASVNAVTTLTTASANASGSTPAWVEALVSCSTCSSVSSTPIDLVSSAPIDLASSAPIDFRYLSIRQLTPYAWMWVIALQCEIVYGELVYVRNVWVDFDCWHIPRLTS